MVVAVSSALGSEPGEPEPSGAQDIFPCTLFSQEREDIPHHFTTEHCPRVIFGGKARDPAGTSTGQPLAQHGLRFLSSPCRKLMMRAGAHLRSYEFAWNLVEQCREKFPTTVLNFFAAHHGKGYCDGAFGLQRHWVSQYARTRNIECLDHMRAALEEGAQGTMALDPPPDGPAYYVKVFEPSPKTAVNKLDTAKCDLQIEYTYCVLFSRAAVGHVRGWNFVYSDRIDKRSAGKSIGTIQSISTPCSDEWRRSYRATQPEKEPPQHCLAAKAERKAAGFRRHNLQSTQYFHGSPVQAREAVCEAESQVPPPKAGACNQPQRWGIQLR